MPIRDIALALCVMLIWGASFPVVKIGLEELPPMLFIAVRFLLVAFPAIFFVPFPKTSIVYVVAVGVLIGVVKFGLLFVAMRADASAGIASLVLQSQIFFTIALSLLFYKERVKRRQLVGIALALMGFSFFFISVGGNVTIRGLALICSAALAWAVSNIVMKKIPEVNLLHFMVWVSVIPPVPLLIISYAIETKEPVQLLANASVNAWLAVAYMGYLSTLIAYAIWGRLLGHHPASTITPFALLIPVIGIVASSAWLGEGLAMMELAGAALIFAGLGVCVIPARVSRACSHVS